jgi:hypothetical protein
MEIIGNSEELTLTVNIIMMRLDILCHFCTKVMWLYLVHQRLVVGEELESFPGIPQH